MHRVEVAQRLVVLRAASDRCEVALRASSAVETKLRARCLSLRPKARRTPRATVDHGLQQAIGVERRVGEPPAARLA